VPDSKTASSKATWALLTEGAASARLEAHRIHHLMDRVLKLVEKSPEKEHLYEVAGDIIQVAPRRMESLERHLDRLSYTLAIVGSDHLRDLLPISDRAMVDDAIANAGSMAPRLRKSTQRVVDGWLARRVARQYLADLTPPLGYPGGPCHVTHRIHEEVKNPKLRDELISDVELGLKIDNKEAHAIYDIEGTKGAGPFKKMEILPHAQYRMDQRSVVVPELQIALRSFGEVWEQGRSLKGQAVKKPRLMQIQAEYAGWEDAMARQEPINWTDPAIRLTIVFVVPRKGIARIITTYWKGQADPRGPGEGACPLPV